MPYMFTSELKEVRNKFKDSKASTMIDHSRAVFIRYEKESEFFNWLHAMRYRVMARLSRLLFNPLTISVRLKSMSHSQLVSFWITIRALRAGAYFRGRKNKRRDEIRGHEARVRS